MNSNEPEPDHDCLHSKVIDTHNDIPLSALVEIGDGYATTATDEPKHGPNTGVVISIDIKISGLLPTKLSTKPTPSKAGTKPPQVPLPLEDHCLPAARQNTEDHPPSLQTCHYMVTSLEFLLNF